MPDEGTEGKDAPTVNPTTGGVTQQLRHRPGGGHTEPVSVPAIVAEVEVALRAADDPGRSGLIA